MRTVRLIAAANQDVIPTSLDAAAPRYRDRTDYVLPWAMDDRTRRTYFDDTIPWDTLNDRPRGNQYPAKQPSESLGLGYNPVRFTQAGLAAWFGRTKKFRFNYDFTMRLFNGYEVNFPPDPTSGVVTEDKSFSGYLEFDATQLVTPGNPYHAGPPVPVDERYLPHGRPPGFSWQWTRPPGDPDDPDAPPAPPFSFLSISLTPFCIDRTSEPLTQDCEAYRFFPKTDFALEGYPSHSSPIRPFYYVYYQVAIAGTIDSVFTPAEQNHTTTWQTRLTTEISVTARNGHTSVAPGGDAHAFPDWAIGCDIVLAGDPQTNSITDADTLGLSYAGPDGVVSAIIYNPNGSGGGDPAVTFIGTCPDLGTGLQDTSLGLIRSVAPNPRDTTDFYPPSTYHDQEFCNGTFSIEPVEFFPFTDSDGANPVWGASSGAQLISPVPPAMP